MGHQTIQKCITALALSAVLLATLTLTAMLTAALYATPALAYADELTASPLATQADKTVVQMPEELWFGYTGKSFSYQGAFLPGDLNQGWTVRNTSRNTDESEIGDYSITVGLKYPGTSIWSDGTTEDKVIDWHIVPSKLSAIGMPCHKDKTGAYIIAPYDGHDNLFWFMPIVSAVPLDDTVPMVANQSVWMWRNSHDRSYEISRWDDKYTMTYLRNGKPTKDTTSAGYVTMHAVSTDPNIAGDVYATFLIPKAKNADITVTPKAVKVTRGKTVDLAKKCTVKKNASKGKLVFSLKSTSLPKSKVKLASNGKLTVKKGVSPKTYTLKAKVYAKATKNYEKSPTKTVTFKVTVN